MMQLAIALTKGLRKGTHQAWRTEGMAVTPASPVRWLPKESKEQKARFASPMPGRGSVNVVDCREAAGRVVGQGPVLANMHILKPSFKQVSLVIKTGDDALRPSTGVTHLPHPLKQTNMLTYEHK